MGDKIFVVTHKKIDKKLKKPNYSYIQVNHNKNGDLGFEYNDATGDNISNKNANFCELTALYWIWKNYKCKKSDIIGLCHYRRFFVDVKLKNKLFVTKVTKFKKLLNYYDIILPKKFKFDMSTYNYYFKSGAGREKDLINVRKIIQTKYPDYIEAFDEFCSSNTGHYCNMMVCNKKLLDNYCKWLFDILFDLELKTDLSDYSVQEARIYGYLSELLLNVYVIKNNLNIKEINMVNIEENIFKKVKNKLNKIKNMIFTKRRV